MPFSTADCKKFLIKTFPDTKECNWKRMRKYKDGETILRDFMYIHLEPNELSFICEATLEESEKELILISSNVTQSGRQITINDDKILKSILKEIKKADCADDNGESLEKVFKSEKFLNNKNALRKLISFNFPGGNSQNSDVLHIPNEFATYYFCEHIEIWFGDTTKTLVSETDLDSLLLEILPDDIGASAESIYYTKREDETISQVYKRLIDLGFVYDECGKYGFKEKSLFTIEELERGLNLPPVPFNSYWDKNKS